jgi:hypothetical protein
MSSPINDPDMFKGWTLKLKLFVILLSIDIDVSVRRTSMLIDDKMSNGLSLTIKCILEVHTNRTFFGH